MPFAKEALKRIRVLERKDPLRIVLEFLIKNAVGYSKAKPWRVIQRHLLKRGVRMTKNYFQQTILSETRAGDIFIGSSNDGYFLICNKDDARMMQEFYDTRIKAEQTHLDHLLSLASVEGWEL